MNKNSTILNLSLIALIVLVTNSCKKKDCNVLGECKEKYYWVGIGEEPKSYLWAQTGSYWIYKHTATGNIDTQTCTGFLLDTIRSKGTMETNKHITVDWERIRRYIYSSFHNRTYFDQTRLKEPDDPNFNNGFTILDRRTSGGDNTPFFHPFDFSAGFGSGSSFVKYAGNDSLLNIQGKPYSNVVKFNIAMDNIEDYCNNSNNIYYWAKGIGLIKKEMITCNSSWELVECNIIK